MNRILCAYLLILSSLVGMSGFTPNPAESEEKKTDLPLMDKKYGIEINPILLLMSDREQTMATGSFSFFNITRKAEIALLFEYLGKIKNHPSYNKTEKYYTIDTMYRKFLRGTQGGLYFSGGIRFRYEYQHDEDADYVPTLIEEERVTKAGISFGIGYRYFSPSGLYWGISLFGGKYFTGIDESEKKNRTQYS